MRPSDSADSVGVCPHIYVMCWRVWVTYVQYVQVCPCVWVYCPLRPIAQPFAKLQTSAVVNTSFPWTLWFWITGCLTDCTKG